MSYTEKISKFGHKNFVPEGWFWLIPSCDVKPKQAKPARFLDHDFVVMRGEDSIIRVFDAYCPHMGAHLCDGTVEKNSIRCPFHYWKFDSNGICEEIPVQSETKGVSPLKKYRTGERYGLIWIWYGEQNSEVEILVIPELAGLPLDSTLGKPFTKLCHPNVMMINAIDAQHFRSVHKLVVDLNMEPEVLSKHCIQFSNTTTLPVKNFFLKWASQFYKNALTYQLTYWWGHTGAVTLGPDFLHFHIIFSLRPNSQGQAEGQTILLTKKRAGLMGFLVNPILLYLTKLVGNYFAKGDTLIFSRIKFNYQTPIKADRAILHFIQHYELQNEGGFTNTAKEGSTCYPKEQMTL